MPAWTGYFSVMEPHPPLLDSFHQSLLPFFYWFTTLVPNDLREKAWGRLWRGYNLLFLLVQYLVHNPTQINVTFFVLLILPNIFPTLNPSNLSPQKGIDRCSVSMLDSAVDLRLQEYPPFQGGRVFWGLVRVGNWIMLSSRVYWDHT